MRIIRKPTQRSMHRVKEWELKYKKAKENKDNREADRCLSKLVKYFIVVD